MRRPTALLAALALAACAGGEPDADMDAPADEVAGTGTATAAAPMEVAGFSTPESVLHDDVADVYLVSNIEGQPLDVDGAGFISRVSPDGTVEALRWIDGATAGVTLNAPKGMAIVGDTLYVADIDCVRRFVRTTGEPAGSMCIEGATFLNDIAVDANDVLYVTDMGMQAGAEGFEPSGSQAIYRFAPDGRHAAIAQGDGLGHPNGIGFGERGGFVVTFGTGEIYQIAGDGTRTTVLPPSEGRQLDGIVFTGDGGFLFSSWGDQAVHRVHPDGNVTRVVEGVASPADIGWDAQRRRVLVPVFTEDRILVQEVPAG